MNLIGLGIGIATQVVGMAASASPDLEITLRTTTASESVTIPTAGTVAYNCSVDWGDGSAVGNYSGTTPVISHTYASAGDYEVTITGDFPRFDYYLSGFESTLVAIRNWGNTLFDDMKSAFRGCVNLVVSATDAPNLDAGCSLYRAFRGCTSLTTVDFSQWDVSMIADFGQMFRDCSGITSIDLSGWDMLAATSLASMFQDSTADPDLSAWDIRNVTDMSQFFGNTISLSTANYDAMLIAWAALPVQSGIAVNFHNTQYTSAAASARSTLTGTHSWLITDGGQV